MLYVCNVDEGDAAEGNALSAKVFEKAAAEGAEAVVVSAAIEAEIATLDAADRAAFLADLGLSETGLTRVIRAGYELLGLITFFTAGPKEARAWTVPSGAKAPQAAGAIHTDFERGFIRAETIAFDDFVACGGETGAQGRRQDARRGQGVCRPGRRRPAVPLQRLTVRQLRRPLPGRTLGAGERRQIEHHQQPERRRTPSRRSRRSASGRRASAG